VAPQHLIMKIMKEEKITVSLTKEELLEAIVFWLSRLQYS
jgi:hypothetical protein